MPTSSMPPAEEEEGTCDFSDAFSHSTSVSKSVARNTATLSCPRLPTTKKLPPGCTRISLEWLAAFHTPCGEMVVLPCSSTGSELRVLTSSKGAPRVKHETSSVSSTPAPPEIHRVGVFTLKHETVLSSSFTRYAARLVGWNARCLGPFPFGKAMTPF
jgi:hypothetical protein